MVLWPHYETLGASMQSLSARDLGQWENGGMKEHKPATLGENAKLNADRENPPWNWYKWN